jgi:ketosteroid isomerase-like protein
LAINSNDTETLMAELTDDIVYQAPNEPEIVGKDAVRKWVAKYFDAIADDRHNRAPSRMRLDSSLRWR